ncbi:uncharacterized protein [Euwallacea similis]|uniref:uncharacterized protein n=1 Tax=Euwallacea similis TaxID=1736056 RepID=UPI00344D28C4
MEGYDSDDSIIENTPEKKSALPVFQKISSKGPRVKTEESNLLEKLIKECEYHALEYTLNETEVFEEKPKAGNVQFKFLNQALEPSLISSEPLNQVLKNFSLTTFNKEERDLNHPKNPDSSNPIYNTQKFSTLVQPIQTTNSRNCHQTHVFYTIAEVLKFNPNNFPKNSNMQIIGSLQYCPKSKRFYLELDDTDTYMIVRIRVNINNLSPKPLIDEDIIVFGTLTFEDEDPVISAMFFQSFSEDYDYVKYIRVMLQLRAMMPLENYKMVSVSTEPMMSELEDYVEFEDFLKTIISVSEDEEVLNSAISDSVLNEFLDDISFEKL